MPTVIRAASAKDIPAINRIYGYYVETCTCTWEENEKVLISADALARRSTQYPFMVVETDGEVLAWGALSAYSLRSGWQPTVEDSVFVHHLHQGKGLGRQMLTTLVEKARALAYRSVIARISGDQPASLGLHQSLGFKEVGRIRSAGKKFGHWLDCAYLQLELGEPKP